MVGNGVADDTVAFPKSLDQLFINTNKANPSSRVSLILAPGTYKLTATVNLPPTLLLLVQEQTKQYSIQVQPKALHL